MDVDIESLSRHIAENVALQLRQQPLPEYITTEQLAHLTGFSLRALEAMRSKRIGPPFIKIGNSKNSAIRYRVEDIRAWMQQHREATYGAR